MEKEPVRELTLFLFYTEPENTGNHIEEEGTIYFLKWFFFNHISFLTNNKIMEKEPVRVLTTFQCDGTKKHWEPQRAREYHLKSLFFLFLFLFFPFVCVCGGVCVCVCVTK